MPRGFIFTAVTLTLFVFFSGLNASAAEYVSVKKDGVNIRSGPTTKNPILWEIFEGFPLKVLDRKEDWVKVQDFENDQGWIYASLLSTNKTIIIKVDTANMRSGPGTNYDIVATVKKGVVFKYISSQGSWHKVSYKDEITGWLHSSLIWPDAF